MSYTALRAAILLVSLGCWVCEASQVASSGDDGGNYWPGGSGSAYFRLMQKRQRAKEVPKAENSKSVQHMRHLNMSGPSCEIDDERPFLDHPNARMLWPLKQHPSPLQTRPAEMAKQDTLDKNEPMLVMYGDSQTYLIGAQPVVKQSMFDAFGEFNPAFFGHSGDWVGQLYYRMCRAEFPAFMYPKGIVIEIGINNLGCGASENSMWSTVSQIRQLVRQVRRWRPKSSIFVLGLNPTRVRCGGFSLQETVMKVNTLIGDFRQYLSRSEKRHTHFVNCGPRLTRNGLYTSGLLGGMTLDLEHPSPMAYGILAQCWKDKIAAVLHRETDARGEGEL